MFFIPEPERLPLGRGTHERNLLFRRLQLRFERLRNFERQRPSPAPVLTPNFRRSRRLSAVDDDRIPDQVEPQNRLDRGVDLCRILGRELSPDVLADLRPLPSYRSVREFPLGMSLISSGSIAISA